MYLFRSIALLLITGLLNSHILISQGLDQEFEKIKVGDNIHLFSWLDLAPDGKTLIISCVQSYPCLLYDISDRKLVGEFDVGDWHAGSKVDLSRTGRYAVLQQLFYVDFAPNKDREVEFDILDISKGQIILKLGNHHSVVITPDEKYAMAFSGEEVAFWDLETGTRVKRFNVPLATNSAAISPDGKYIVVSHRPSDDYLEAVFPKDKDNRKSYGKYKQLISVYDATSFDYINTLPDFFNIVYRLEFSADGNYLFCHHAPHSKFNPGASINQSYVNVIDVSTWKKLRKGYASQSVYEPDFGLSGDNKYFAISSASARFPEVHIYDFETGKMLYRKELSYRLFENWMDEKEFPSDNRIAFNFLPGNNSMVVTFGNRLLLWNFLNQ